MIEEFVPASVLALRTESNLDVVNPWFEKSLGLPGDVCEFGCYRGTMSIKYAFWIKALGYDKGVYAYDTFQGFLCDDPAGSIRKGDYSDCALDDLMRWSVILPLQIVKCDIRNIDL